MEQLPLLHTKLFIPPLRPELVSRPRLIRRLDAALPVPGTLSPPPGSFTRALTLISAPAGFGKTTLVSEWIHGRGAVSAPGSDAGASRGAGTAPLQAPDSKPLRVAWLSLDERDNDPARFLAYVIAALRNPRPAIPAASSSIPGLALSSSRALEGPAEGPALSSAEGPALSSVEGPEASLGRGMLGALQSPQPPPAEAVLTALINDIAALPGRIILVLDDYHLIEDQSIHDALDFFLNHLPPQMHLVIATRQDPDLSLSRQRARGRLTELRAADLRFSHAEAAEFLNRVMGLELSAEDTAALEARTEGWIAGLQLAAVSMQGREDTATLVRSFTGSHRYVLDYLIEEVLDQQPASIQNFLLQTAFLERLNGSLCDAVRFGSAEAPSTPGGDAVRFGSAESPSTPGGDAARSVSTGIHRGQEILEALDRANLFIVPLDNERRWYRYHHLFRDLLLQRVASLAGTGGEDVAERHTRASVWYEENGFVIEAFRHAAAASDVDHALRLIEGGGMPLTFRGALAPVLHWLESLPDTVLDAHPLLWITYATALLAMGQGAGVEPRLRAAEAAIAEAAAEAAIAGAAGSAAAGPDAKSRDLIGRIAATRATLAWGQNQPDAIIAQSQRALEYLDPDNLPFRTSTTWKLGSAYQMQGDFAAAGQAYAETNSICEKSGNVFIHIMSLTGLGQIQEVQNQLYQAEKTYHRLLQLAGDDPPLAATGAFLGLARIFYEWNDLVAARQHGQQAIQLARRIDSNDAFAQCALFLARLRLAQGDAPGAAALLAEAEQFARDHGFLFRLPDIVALQVRTCLHQGRLADAAHLADEHQLPLSQARVCLAQGDPSAALVLLEPRRQQAESEGREAVRLRVMVLQALALAAHGQGKSAVKALASALALAEPGGIIRTFVDEGPPMARLLEELRSWGGSTAGITPILAAFEAIQDGADAGIGPQIHTRDPSGRSPTGREPAPARIPEPARVPPVLVEPLSERELEVLQLIAQGLTNREIASRLFVSLNTVKAHTRNIYGKLDVHSRTRAVARSRELGLLARGPA